MLNKKTRDDKNTHRKVKVNELAEAITDVLPSLRFNKTGAIPKMTLYRKLLQQNYFAGSQLSQTTFYRLMRDNDLLNSEQTQKLRQSFAIPFANELWQADTMHGPSIKQCDGKWRKTFLIAFSALFKRGKPQRLYFDNGSNYTSKEILQACVRLNIHLSHAPVRDGAAKGKIERFFRGFRDRFLTLHTQFESLDELNDKTRHWIENDNNSQHHSGIQMTPLDRFNLDRGRLHFLTDDETTEEIFFVEESRQVSKTNVFAINTQKYECPVDLREKKVQVRFDRSRRDKFIVYFNEQRMGQATLLDLHFNATKRSARSGDEA